MLTGIVKAAFRSTGGVGFEPLAVVERIAASVDAIGPERFVTLFAARVLGGGRRLEYVSAGHPSAILWGEGREPVSLASTGLIVTPAFPKAVRRKESVDLRPGDRLLVYTDGVTDAGSDEEQFGFERLLRHAVGSGAARGALLDDVVAEVRRFGEGRPQGDDWTLLLLGVE